MTDELKYNPFKPLSQVSLSGTEKAKIRGNIRGFMALDRGRHWYGWLSHHVAASLVVVFLAGGTGVLLAADSAGPDSALFQVRTTVNDQVRVAVVRDEDARIERELQVLGRYIEGEEQLALHELAY